MDTISTQGISVRFDPEGGIIDDVAIEAGGRTIRPLHRAPWAGSGETLPADVAPVERKLAGDFLCAPFARSEGGAPIHGWTANGTWQAAGIVEAHGSVTASYDLRESVAGASVSKEIMLVPGHPVVYQTHVLDGGAGKIPVAHHAMVHVPGGARLSFSPKLRGRTPATPLETDPARGRTVLASPQEFASLAAVRRADGGTADASFYPFDRGHEDLVVLTERPGSRVGWSAALARQDGFLFFAVKDARALPQTVLWMSNGGRYYAPWNGRHLAVLGIEEAATGLHLEAGESDDGGVAAALELAPGRRTATRYAFGAIPVPDGWSEVADIRVEATTLTLADRGGGERRLPFRGDWLDGQAAL